MLILTMYLFFAQTFSDSIPTQNLDLSSGTMLDFEGTGDEHFSIWNGEVYSASAAFHDVQRLGDNPISWGSNGQGPADLNNISHILVNEQGVSILNLQPNKIVQFDHNGNHLKTITIRNGEIVTKMTTYKDGFLVSSKTMSGQRSIIYVTDETEKVVKTYSGPGQVKLKADSGPVPSLSVGQPLNAQLWTANQNGFFFWDKKTLQSLSFDKDEGTPINLPINSLPVTDAFKEQYFDRLFPTGESSFGQTDLFSGFRKLAEKQLEFPDKFPNTIKLMGAGTALFSCQGFKSSQEVWLIFKGDKVTSRMILPKNTKLVAVSEKHFATLTLDDGENVLHIFNY